MPSRSTRAAIQLQRGLVGRAVGARGLGAEARAQPRVDHPVLRGDLRRRVAGDAVADPVGLEQHDARARLLQQQRGRDADDPAADHGDVGARRRRRAARSAGCARRRSRSRVERPVRAAALMALRGAARAPRGASATRRCAPCVRRATSGLRASTRRRRRGSRSSARPCRRPRGVISSVTFAVPSGGPWRAAQQPRRLGLEHSVWSRSVSGPTPIVWWNFEPGAGQSRSASRIAFEPTTQ